MNHTHDLADWFAFVSLGIGIHAALSVPYFLLVESESARDFDPRPAVRRTVAAVHQGAVYAGHDLNRAIAASRRHLAPYAVCVWHAVYAAREMARDAAALLILLTTSPKGASS